VRWPFIDHARPVETTGMNAKTQSGPALLQSTDGAQHRLIDGPTAAFKAGCSHRHWQRLCKNRLAPAGVKIGTLRRWDARAIDEWIADGCPALSQQEGGRP